MGPFKYKGRDVVINVVSFGDLLDASDLRDEQGNDRAAMWLTLSRAAHYADDGEKVFPTPADVTSAPATESANIMRMAAEAARVNNPGDTGANESPT